MIYVIYVIFAASEPSEPTAGHWIAFFLFFAVFGRAVGGSIDSRHRSGRP